MKLHEIREYDPDPAENTPTRFMEDIVWDLEPILGKWTQNNNRFTFYFGNGELAEFDFYYKAKPKSDQHHRKTGQMTLINAHSVQMTVHFPKQPMNLANLHDDPEIQKKLLSKMKMPDSYFEKHPDQLKEIFEVMLNHGADAFSSHQQSFDPHGDEGLELLKKAKAGEKDGMYHYARFDFLFLTQPLA